MEPVNNQDVLISLLKDGHISKDEFKSLYEKCKEERKIRMTGLGPVFDDLPFDYNRRYDSGGHAYCTKN